MPGKSCGELVGKPGQHILFMNHDGQSEPSGGEVSRCRDISAKAEHDVSLRAPQQSDGGLHRLKQPRSDQ